jgi:hypothetical protein
LHALGEAFEMVEAREIDLHPFSPAQNDVEIGIGNRARARKPVAVGKLLIRQLEFFANE